MATQLRVGLWGGRKNGETRGFPWEQGQEPATNSLHIQGYDTMFGHSSPGHTGGRSELSPYTYSPNI